ncbi:MAG: hypothetical protein PHU29_03695 [Sulfuricurvum sp.]|nr:hypothetical protein [Sulfuricurvum sp.]
MNLLKWLINILFGWVMYVPKAILRVWAHERERNLKESNKMAEENRLFNKDFNDKYIFSALILVLPLLLSEDYIAQCGLCQTFIGFMSLWIPGISVMSKASVIPQMVAMEISIAWLMVFLAIVINLYRAWWKKTLFIQQTNHTKHRMGKYFLGKIVFLIFELTKSPISFYHGTIGEIQSELRRNDVYDLLQYKIGIWVIACIEVFWLTIVYVGLILISFEILKSLGKRIKGNEH